ncbi:ImuA family protein [Lunatibacter salilacus]|uniref:ImuA family protein n=1 Tax=Lunatibacter salilacus TaxID=2483804 RepID=UPI00131CE89D|nr:Error-prone repair protein ImuA [Lunatibacter salilacus]
MELTCEKIDRLRQLRKDVMALEGSIPNKGTRGDFSVKLGPMEAAFPGRTFPLSVNHEFISTTASEAASTQGFVAAMLGMLLRKGGYSLWIGNSRKAFPPALGLFGVTPQQVIFVDVKSERDVLWTMEQALKCNALVAVVGELRELDFAQSQRLQLAVEHSRVTGFIHRHQPRSLHALACNTRWKISPIASQPEEGMPGLGFPTWNVELLKVRNGRPGAWQMEWKEQGFWPLSGRKPIPIKKEERQYA